MSAPDSSIPTQDPKSAPPARRGTLLVVDDDPGVRFAVNMAFKDDYTLHFAEDGPKAIALAAEKEFDVAIMDIRMPGMSGIEVLSRLRESHPGIEVIMFTAFETTETMRDALRLRACDYINKPFDLATIRNAVADAMKRRMLEAANSNRSEQVQELLAELQERAVSEQMAKSQRDIYASIIHDINGPLTVISGFVQIINAKLNAGDASGAVDLEFVRDRMRIVERQVGNCVEIPRRYLGFLRRQREGSAAAGLGRLLQDLEHLVRVHPSLQENEFVLAPLEKEVAVKANGTDVIQILLNLAVNAFQCSPVPHRVEIGGEMLAAPLDLARFKDGPNDRLLNIESMENAAPLVRLWVRDTGPGIPEDVLPRIFQSYFTTKSQGQGTGLGLSIIQRLIKEARGGLHVHTRVGEGTTFTVYLPGAHPAA